MIFRSCPREAELTQALKDGCWPEGCDRELRAHVDVCASCNDLVLVTQTFQQARKESTQELPPVAPGLLWWRAQLRQRNAATELVSQPIAVAQTFAWVVVVLVAAILVASQVRSGLQWASQAFHLWSLAAVKLDWGLLLIPSLGVLALLSVVLYLAWEKQ
jgi:hypothetical protein